MCKATSVKALDDFTLDLTFDDGSRKFFDVTPYLDKGNFSELNDPLYFKQVKLAIDTVRWPNGQKLVHETLYFESISLPDDPLLPPRYFFIAWPFGYLSSASACLG